MKATCILNDDLKKYPFPLIIIWEPEIYILHTAAKNYLNDYQSIFQTKKSMPLNAEKKDLIEKELNEMLKKYRDRREIFFKEEINLIPIVGFPKKLKNEQIVIHHKMIKIS